VTAAIPAFLLLTDLWRYEGAIAIGLAVGGVVVFGALYAYIHPRAPGAPAATPSRTAHPAPG
jgi:hypothetical protein